MSQAIDEAIELSRQTLVLRDQSSPFIPPRNDLPEDVVKFMERVADGVLFPIEFEDETDGFELDSIGFAKSINEFYDIPPGDSTFAYCDLCFVMFRSPVDFESAWGLDLNPGSYGRVFACRM